VSNVQITIGCPEFWPEFYKAHAVRLRAMEKLTEFINVMFTAAQNKGATEPVERVVDALTRITVTSLDDVIVLCGNGSGTGALKIVRGMFESSTVAEYLRLHPSKVQDYEDFRHVIAWRRYQQVKNVPGDPTLSDDRIDQIQKEYDRVKGRFIDAKGNERSQWSQLSIKKMASASGRGDQYESVYSWLSSLHHLSPEGLTAHLESMNGSPSLHLTDTALVVAHGYVILALQTLNDCCSLGLGDKLGEAQDDFRNSLKTNESNPPQVTARRNQT
jgi:hypothetical protein